MDQRSQIIDSYNTLAAWCDSFFSRVRNARARDMQCARACCSCCILSSVNQLEGALIHDWLQNNPPPPRFSTQQTLDNNSCPFLHGGICSVYPVRPIICRTHGLALLTEGTLSWCPLNFRQVAETPVTEDIILDNDTITNNLVRLNQAWCMVVGLAETAISRVSLTVLAASWVA